MSHMFSLARMRIQQYEVKCHGVTKSCTRVAVSYELFCPCLFCLRPHCVEKPEDSSLHSAVLLWCFTDRHISDICPLACINLRDEPSRMDTRWLGIIYSSNKIFWFFASNHTQVVLATWMRRLVLVHLIRLFVSRSLMASELHEIPFGLCTILRRVAGFLQLNWLTFALTVQFFSCC